MRIEVDGSTIEVDAPIPVTIATSAPIERWGVMEALDCSPAGVDLSRSPLSLITGHDQSRLAIGVVDHLVATGDRVTGLVRFSSSAEAQQVRTDVLAGIHLYVSVGYERIDEGQPIEGGFRYRWMPHEVSVVSVPADANAGFFRSFAQGKAIMPALNTPDAAATQAAHDQIIEIGRRYGLEGFTRGLTAGGATIEQTRSALLDELARRDAAAGGHLNISWAPEGARQGGTDRQAIIDTLAARMGVRSNGATIIRSVDCVGLAQRTLNMAGVRVPDDWSRTQIIERAFHTTSDFPALLGSAVGRVLHEAYAAAPAALKAVGRKVNASDFRARSIIRVGSAPDLEKVDEHGEFKYGTIGEGTATWKLSTFGRIFAVTRQALVNDDLGGFADLAGKFGEAASRREAEELVAILLAPPAIDGGAMFSAARSSLIPDALSITGLGNAVLALRKQTDLDGRLLSQDPAQLVVPAALEMKARQLVATINATQAGDVQPFKVDVVVEPRLDASSAIVWYLVAARQSALEYGYLDGNEGVQIIQREGFEVDGLEVKARLDFGCGWGAPTGWVKSNGNDTPL